MCCGVLLAKNNTGADIRRDLWSPYYEESKVIQKGESVSSGWPAKFGRKSECINSWKSMIHDFLTFNFISSSFMLTVQ